MTFPFPFMLPRATPGGTSQVTISVPSGTTHYTNSADQTTYTSGTLDFGSDDAGRIIAVAIGGTQVSSRTISSATIGGVSASVRVDASTTGASGLGVAAILTAAPSGTTGTVSVTFSGSLQTFGCKVYRIDGAASAVPSDTATVTTDTDPHNGSIDYATDCGVIGVSFQNASTSYTWRDSQGNTWTEGFDGIIEASRTFSTAYAHPGSSGTGVTVTADLAGTSPARHVSAWAVWSP